MGKALWLVFPDDAEAELAQNTYGGTTFRVVGINSAIKDLKDEECQMQIVVNPGFDVNEWIVLDSLVRPDVPMVMLNGNLDKAWKGGFEENTAPPERPMRCLSWLSKSEDDDQPASGSSLRNVSLLRPGVVGMRGLRSTDYGLRGGYYPRIFFPGLYNAKERFLKKFETVYYLKALPGGWIFRRAPEDWQVVSAAQSEKRGQRAAESRVLSLTPDRPDHNTAVKTVQAAGREAGKS
ncbi:unnamed protein product [Ectocarpus sp. 13 AM-2016]